LLFAKNTNACKSLILQAFDCFWLCNSGAGGSRTLVQTRK